MIRSSLAFCEIRSWEALSDRRRLLVPEVGAFLSSEEHGPRALLDQAKMAEAPNMRGVFISDQRDALRFCRLRSIALRLVAQAGAGVCIVFDVRDGLFGR
jgi:hypothetical protein